MKRSILNLFRSSYAAFSSQIYSKTTTLKTIASCKQKFASLGTYGH